MQNPFTYTFGVKPKEYIKNTQSDVILENFSYAEPSERTYMITGIRGSGKTVMLSEISEQIGRKDDWIVIDLNPSRDLLQSLGAQLGELPFMKRFFTGAKIDVSLFGFGVSLQQNDSTKLFDIESAIGKMLEAVSKSGKKVLITIDEASPSKDMRVFTLSFQRLIRKQLPVYMILTGLFHNVHNLKNMDGCTFLQRAPFIVLTALDINTIAVRYKKVFKTTKEFALQLAKQTKGYAFAFQVLGKIYFDRRHSDTLEDILAEFENELITYSYNKIWSELSATDISVIKAIISLGSDAPVSRSALMERLQLSSSMMNKYQARLREKGILLPAEQSHGKYVLALPCFDSFVSDYHMDD